MSDDDRDDEAAAQPTDRANVGGLGGKSSRPEEQVARMALEALPEALKVILSVMRKPGRGAQSQLVAALKVVDLAQKYQTSAAPDTDSKQYVLDREQAARVLADRLGLQR